MALRNHDRRCVVCGRHCASDELVLDPARRCFCRACYDRAVGRTTESVDEGSSSDVLLVKPRSGFLARVSPSVIESLMGSLPRPALPFHCPECGGRLAHGSSLCVKCNRDVRLMHLDPRTADLARDAMNRYWSPDDVGMHGPPPRVRWRWSVRRGLHQCLDFPAPRTRPPRTEFGRQFQVSRYYCRTCRTVTEIRRRNPNARFHLALTVITLGAWSVIWLGVIVASHLRRWRCVSCRGHVRRAVLD